MFSRGTNRKVYKHWCLIQDVIGSAKHWPKYIRKLFWTRHIGSRDRAMLCTFYYGLSPQMILDWAELISIFSDDAAKRHYLYVHNTFDENIYEYMYICMDITFSQTVIAKSMVK